MPLSVTSNAVINNFWTAFKSAVITGKNLQLQYDNDGTVYTIFAFDGPVAYRTVIWQGTVPDSVVASGYSQSQNDSDKSDFTTNYQSTANKSVSTIQTVQSTAAWTSSTTVNTALALTVTGYGTVTITLNQGSTITGGVVTFEVSDTLAGTNWYPISVISTAGATTPSNTYTLQATTNASFQTNVAGYVQFRVRLSTIIAGTATVNVGVAAGASAAEWQQATYITDASHGPVAVKAGSTASVAGDPSLVTAFSPNSPLPTGSNVIGALTANQSVNVAQVAGSATSTAATGVQKVGVVGSTGTALDGTTAGVLDENIKNVGGSAVVTAATGVQKVGVVGGTGTSLETTAGVLDHNLKNVANAAVVTAATGVQKVGIVGGTGTALDGTTAGILDENIKNVGGSAVVTAATGVQKVGIVGSTGTALDSTTAGVLDGNIRNIGGNAVSTAGSGIIKVGIVGSATAPLDAAIGVGTAPTNGLGVLAQYNTSLPAPTNQQTMSLQADQSGNVLEFPGVQTKTGAAWTSSTTINTLQYPTGTTTIGAPTGATAIVVQLDQTTTLTGGAVTFQGTYDGTNWVTIPTAQVLNPQTYAQLTNPYTFVASTNQPFLIMLQGFQQIRLNLTTLITGTGSVTPQWTVLGISPISTVAIANGFNKVQGMGADAAAATGNPNLIAGIDQSGNARIPRVDSSFRQMPGTEPPWSAVMGTIGSSPIAEMAFGYVASSAKTTIPIRATTYTQISGAPVQVSVKSTSASDASAGTGSRTITITYLTTGAVRKTEVITMNGTTAVNSVNTDYAFIEKVVTSTAGSSRTNVGTITVFQGAGGTGTALCSIVIGDGRTNYCHHYVTSGKTCYITSISFSSNSGVGTNGNIFLQITNPAETDVLEQFCSSFRTAAQLSFFQVNLSPPIKVPQSDITNGSLIIAYVTPDATTATNWWVSFNYIEV